MNHPNQQNISDIHIIGKNTHEWLIKEPARHSGMSIALTGISHAKYPFHFRRINPPMTHVIVCWSGSGRVLINGKFKNCGPGQAYITPPYQLHEYFAARGQTWKFTWMHVYIKDESLIPLQPMMVKVDGDAFHEIISGFHREYISNRDSTVIDSWHTILHRQCLRLLGGGGVDLRLRRLWHLVDANLGQNWTLEKMAEIAELSEEHLRRLCVSQYGVSPMRHLVGMRMQRASAMLKSTNLKVEQISSIVGYGNPLAFSTAFRKYMNHTPSEFRKLPAQI